MLFSITEPQQIELLLPGISSLTWFSGSVSIWCSLSGTLGLWLLYVNHWQQAFLKAAKISVPCVDGRNCDYRNSGIFRAERIRILNIRTVLIS